MPRDALAITGATATGKTRLAVAVARRLDGEIISMDSRQVYRGMDIGTAKATAEERDGVPHHGLDLVEPGTRYSAGQFARDARRWIREIRGRGRVPVLAGGTGFFLRALTHPLFAEPPMDPERRRRLGRWLDRRPEDELARWLEALDPESARRLRDGGGRQRVQRALEVAILTGRTLPWWHRNRPGKAPPLDPLIVVVEWPREALYDRINRRVDAMVDAGLAAEVRRLLDAGHGPDRPGMTATGYPEMVAHLQGGLEIEEAKEQIRRATRRYARRQLTWFRHQLPDDAIRLDGTRPADDLVEEVVERWRSER